MESPVKEQLGESSKGESVGAKTSLIAPSFKVGEESL
jgi:hypothetical protein